MNPLGDQASTLLRFSREFQGCNRLPMLVAVVVACLNLVLTAASEAQPAVLQFIAPTNGAIFSTLDEIPIVLRAYASNDVFLGADVFANNWKIATVSYCCSLCPCARPLPGQETIL